MSMGMSLAQVWASGSDDASNDIAEALGYLREVAAATTLDEAKDAAASAKQSLLIAQEAAGDSDAARYASDAADAADKAANASSLKEAQDAATLAANTAQNAKDAADSDR